jgi:hypothetical protein
MIQINLSKSQEVSEVPISLNPFVNENGFSSLPGCPKFFLQLFNVGLANLEISSICVEFIQLCHQIINISVLSIKLGLIPSLSLYDNVFDGIDVIQGLIDFIHVPRALHDKCLALGTFFVLHSGGISCSLPKVHPEVQPFDLEGMPALQLDEAGVEILLIAEMDLKGIIIWLAQLAN